MIQREPMDLDDFLALITEKDRERHWNTLMVAPGETWLALLGAHGDAGWCWCQPRMIDCTNGPIAHQHVVHQDGPQC